MPTIVKLHLYDLSNGMARGMSMAIIGKQLDGIWHSGIVVFGVEYFFGGGICAAPAGRAIPGMPYEEITLGTTTKTQIEMEFFLQSVSHRFTQSTYSLLRHNCNNFANELSQYLLNGSGIPEHIIRLPQEFLSSPMGLTMAPMIETMERNMREQMVGGGQGLNPFGHIQRTPILDVHNEDARLLKTALDGIPVTIMSLELKTRILESDESSFPQVIEIMKNKFNPEKLPVLLSFGTIVRGFIMNPSFAIEINKTSLLRDLLHASFKIDNPHTFNMAMAITSNLTGKEGLDDLILPTLMEALSGTVSKTVGKAVLNVLSTSPACTEPNFIALETATVESLIRGAGDATELLMEAAEKGAERLSGVKHVSSIDPTKLIETAEQLEAKFPNRSLRETISYILS